MIVSATNENETHAMLEFLRIRGVVLPWSTDLRMLGRVSSEGKLCGVVAYNGFSGAVCCMHCAGDGNWISREFLRIAFDYPFNVCKVVAIFGTVSSSNLQALRLDAHLGFTEVHEVPKGWDGESDLILMRMMRTECRWIKEKADEHKTSRGAAVGSSA